MLRAGLSVSSGGVYPYHLTWYFRPDGVALCATTLSTMFLAVAGCSVLEQSLYRDGIVPDCFFSSFDDVQGLVFRSVSCCECALLREGAQSIETVLCIHY